MRSVPLGQKRKRGRPKQIPNCLVKSPIRVPPVLNNDALEDDLRDLEDPPSSSTAAPPVKKTSRKRKVQEPEADDENVVGALLSQSQSVLKPGLGVSKPPKKKVKSSRNQEPMNQEPSTQANSTQRPLPLTCKKKAGSCNHEIVFGNHYSKVVWAKYLEDVRAKKSTTVIDPDYVS